jgi:methylated-DNA-[protein]-cysteine S-methyltransferase
MTASLRRLEVDTTIGPLVLVAAHDALVAAHFTDQARRPRVAGAIVDLRDPLLLRAGAAVSRYLDGAPLEALPLRPCGTPFQEAVWQALQRIPHGCTTTYGELAASLGIARAVRAVGQAIGRNPLALFVPCHRVVGRSGALTGYAGGLARKRALLALEQATPALRPAA